MVIIGNYLAKHPSFIYMSYKLSFTINIIKSTGICYVKSE